MSDKDPEGAISLYLTFKEWQQVIYWLDAIGRTPEAKKKLKEQFEKLAGRQWNDPTPEENKQRRT